MKKTGIIITIVFMTTISFVVMIGMFKRNRIIYCFDACSIKAGEYERIVYDGISLNPGVYRIETNYSYDTHNSQMFIAYYVPRDPNIGKFRLRSTGSNLYINRYDDTQDFYLYEKTDDLYISVTAYYDDFTIDSLKIFDTGKLWFCLAIRLALIYSLIMLLLFAFGKIRNGSISNEVVRRWIIFFAIWVLSAIPWLCGLTILTPDGPYHMERVEGVANALRGGLFPIRIEPSWLQGYGYANGLYYSDLFLVFPSPHKRSHKSLIKPRV